MLAPTIRILKDPRGVGMAAAQGLAQELAVHANAGIRYSTVTAPAYASLLPPAMVWRMQLYGIDHGEDDEPASITISSSGRVQPALIDEGRRGSFTICIQRPRGSPEYFHSILAPRHDYNAIEAMTIDNKPCNTILTTGSVGLINRASLNSVRARAEKRFKGYRCPLIAALIGGDNRSYRAAPNHIIDQLQAIVQATQGSLLITTSRRSGTALKQSLKKAFGNDGHYLWDGEGDKLYWQIMAVADSYCVTVDSVNMISEACSAGGKVYLLRLPHKTGGRAKRGIYKFTRFHNAVIQQGLARFWEGSWHNYRVLPPLTETARAARQIWQQYLQHSRLTTRPASSKITLS